MIDGRRSARPGTRSVPRRGYAPPAKSNTGLIIGGVAGGLVLLIVVIAAVASSGGGSRKAAPASHKPAARPVDVSGLERVGMAKCDEGLMLVQRSEGLMSGRALDGGDKSKLRGDLERGKNLLVEGMGMLDEANQKTQGQNKYDTTRYGQALKTARGKLLEMSK